MRGRPALGHPGLQVRPRLLGIGECPHYHRNMPAPDIARVRAQIDALYRKDSRRIFATLIRLLGDFERAEEALHEAFRTAMEKWPAEGLPQNPVAWLVSAGRFKSIDKQRRDKRFEHLEDRPDVSEALVDQTPA